MKFSIDKKFGILLVAFLALQVLQLGVGIYQVRHIATEAELLSGAGKVRPLFLAELARRALKPGGQQANHLRAFRERVALHDDIHRRLWEEYAPQVASQRYGELARLVIEANGVWQKELHPLLLAVDPARPRAAAAALARFEAAAPAQVERAAKIVAYLERDIVNEMRKTVRNHALIFILSILFAAIAVWLVRRHVTAPLRVLATASQAVAEGVYDRRVEVDSTDEIGGLVNTFNRMAGAVADRTAQLDALNQVAVTITSSLGLEQVLGQIMRHGAALTGSRASCIAFYNQETKRFTEWVTEGLSDRFVKNMSFRPGGLADEAFTTTTTTEFHILSNDRPEARHKLSKLTREEGIKSFICLPLTSRASRLGVIYFYRTDRDTFLPAEIELAGTFASLAAQAIENARLHERVVQQSVTDALTGLHNRRWLDERLTEELSRAQRFGKPLSVLMLDIDHFKQINDTHGHDAGDAVLKTLARVLSEQARGADILARYGGEEFVFVLSETDSEGALTAAKRIRHAVASTTFDLPGGAKIRATVSVGIASYPAGKTTGHEPLIEADKALYIAKQTGRDQVVLYR